MLTDSLFVAAILLAQVSGGNAQEKNEGSRLPARTRVSAQDGSPAKQDRVAPPAASQLGTTGRESTLPADAGIVRLTDCVISSKNPPLHLPAQEAGVLMSLSTDTDTAVVEGLPVVRGMRLGNVDDSKSQVQKLAAQREFESAKEQAENNADVEAAEATTQVAKAEFDNSVEINKARSAAVSKFELRRLELTYLRSLKQSEVARMEKRVAALTMAVKKAQIDAADLDITRRQIISPVDGEVVQVFKHVGEWVNPGDTVLRIVEMKRLRVEGYVDASKYTPEQLSGHAATVLVHLPSRDVEFPATVDYVSPIVEASGEFRIWVDVENRKEGDFWVLRPGLNAEVHIQLDEKLARSR